LEGIDPYDLQDLVAALLEAMGYHVSWISPRGKDGGLDIVEHSDPLGTTAPRIKVQVKRRKDSIGVEELRSFLALINDDDVGIFITKSKPVARERILRRPKSWCADMSLARGGARVGRDADSRGNTGLCKRKVAGCPWSTWRSFLVRREGRRQHTEGVERGDAACARRFWERALTSPRAQSIR